MATTGKINGTDFLLYIGGTAITHSTSCSIDLVMATIPSTTKDSAGWDENLAGVRSWSGSADAAVALDATYGIEEIWGAINSQASATVKFATSDVADRFFSGTARITGCSATAGTEDLSPFSVSFVGTGKLKFAVT